MKPGFTRNDLELLFVVLCWAFNVVVVKVVLGEMRPLAFNIVRFICATLILVLLTRFREGSLRVDRADLPRFLALGLVGHTMYQLCFVLGLARTTASSTALIFGSTPVVVGILSRLAGHEKMGWGGSAGAALAFYGVYLIASRAASGPEAPAAQMMTGNLLVVGAVLCWSVYTVFSKRLLERYSPLRVTAVTMALGTFLLAPFTLPDVLRQDWESVSARAWLGLAYSFLFALVVAYILWYRSVKKVGNLKTAIYSNLVPVFGAFFGVWLLHEHFSAGLGLGAASILGGIALTRLQRPDGIRKSSS